MNIDEDLSNIIVDFTTNAKLNLDDSDLKSYIRFGSTRELLRVSIENIIQQYPGSLYIDSQQVANGAITVQNYSYDPLTNVSEFIIPSAYAVNKFELVFNLGNTSTPYNNELKNLNISYSRYNIWRVDDPEDETHTILGFTGDSESVPYMRIQAYGDPFPEISGGSTSAIISYHLKPQPNEYNRFKLDLTQLEDYILLDRLEDRTAFAIKFKEPSTLETGGVVYTERTYMWSTSDGYNIEIASATYQRFLEAILNLGDLYDRTKTDLIARFLTPESLKLYDLTDEGKITKLLRIYGAEFDQIRAFIDGIVTINKTTYDKKNNIPDQLVQNLAKTLGWDPFVLIDSEQFVNSFFNLEEEEKKDDLLPAEVDIELWRRILINTNYFWKSKGTRHALKSMLLLIGIPDPFINITEYIYTVEGRIDPNTVTFTLEDLPSSTLPYDSEGYPVAPAETDDFYFQLSGVSDGGQSYIDLYRNVGFRVNRMIDNQKSWAAAGFTQRIDDNTPNYYQEDSRLVLNTKEIDATLDIARGIEYDVFCYNQNIDDPFTSSGVTIPYLFVNIEMGWSGSSAYMFPLPETPLTGSSVQLNFNGITLTPTGATDISGNTLGVGDYYVSGNTVILVDPANAAQEYSNGTRDVITVTYLYDQLGSEAFKEVQYVVLKPDIIAAGVRLDMGVEPKGDVQLTINGLSLTKRTTLMPSADFFIDPNDRTQIIVQNSELISYLNAGAGILRIWMIYDGSIPSTAEKRSEAYRVDSIPSSRVEYNPIGDQYSYQMDYAAFDVQSVKITINGISLESGVDFILDSFDKSKILCASGIVINYGDIIGAYYIVSDGSYYPPMLPPDPSFPPISEMTFLEYLELINRRLVPVQIRKTISDGKTGYYPTVLRIYEEYLRRSFLPESHPLHSNGYTFAKVYPFIEKYNAFFNRFITQLLPATIIPRKAGIMIRNTEFTRQKFMYRRGVNFDPSLQYLGDNGVKYIKKLPDCDCDWDDDFVCVTAETPTTTTTTTVAPTTTTTTTVAPSGDIVFAMISGSNIYVTNNGGTSFNDVTPLGTPVLSDIDFGFTETGYTVGNGFVAKGVYSSGLNDVVWSDESSNIPVTFSTTNIEAVGRYPLINNDVFIIQSTQGDIGVSVNGGLTMLEGGYYVINPSKSFPGGVTVSDYGGGGTGSVYGFANGGRSIVGGGYFYKNSADPLGWYNAPSSVNSEYPSTNDIVWQFDFQDPINGFAIRKNAGSGSQPFKIRKTTNTGATWSDQYDSTSQPTYRVSGSGGNPFGFDMINAARGWASASLFGGGVVVLRTLNGGLTWDDTIGASLPPIVTSCTNIIAFDALTAYLSTNDGIYETTDGGTTWVKKNVLTGRMSKIADNR